jgi:hypothetical protein
LSCWIAIRWATVSLTRPGGNITDVTASETGLADKRLDQPFKTFLTAAEHLI